MRLTTTAASYPPIVVIPGAGGFAKHKDKLVQACESHGETFLLDYPDLAWTLSQADLLRVAEEMHARIRDRMLGRPFVLAGVSLGAIVAALIAELDRSELPIVRIIGIDPAGSLELSGSSSSTTGAGWLARNLTRVRQAGVGGSPQFVWVRFNRIFAILLARWFRRHPGLGGAVAQFFATAGLARLVQELRMRVLIDMTTQWRRDAKRLLEVTNPSKVPCLVLHTAATRVDVGFWHRHFECVRVTGIRGDHDTWYDFDGPARLVSEWDALGRAAA